MRRLRPVERDRVRLRSREQLRVEQEGDVQILEEFGKGVRLLSPVLRVVLRPQRIVRDFLRAEAGSRSEYCPVLRHRGVHVDEFFRRQESHFPLIPDRGELRLPYSVHSILPMFRIMPLLSRSARLFKSVERRGVVVTSAEKLFMSLLKSHGTVMAVQRVKLRQQPISVMEKVPERAASAPAPRRGPT
jgi:hypothetical protein